jgi:DNA-directed RNA polymerase subunit L
MELKLVEKEKTSIKVEIVHPDDTLIYPLVTALLKDEDVADAQYVTGHPQLDKPVLSVKTKKGEAQAALKRAAEGLAERHREAKGLLEKALAK